MVRQILADNPNVEYHIWNFARNDTDRAYIKTISGPQITVFNGTSAGFAAPATTGDGEQFGANEHNAAYHHYSQPKFRDHLFMKVDDDIVFLETARFRTFVAAIAAHPTAVLAANIINNGACTPVEPGIWKRFQAMDLPLLDIHLSYEFANMAHTYFLTRHVEVLDQPVELIPTEDWLSINAVGYAWPTIGRVLSGIGKPHPSFLAGRSMRGWGSVFGDEGVFQTLERIVVKGFTVAHLTYGPQAPTDAQITRWRTRYAKLGQEYLRTAVAQDSEELPKLSDVSCGQGPFDPVSARWGANNWRTRILGENDPLAGRYRA